MTKNDKPKLRDVARLAGVSLGSASRALSNPDQVKPSTLAKVDAAVRQLQYVMDGAARALALRRTFSVAAIFPTLNNPIYADSIQALQQRLQGGGRFNQQHVAQRLFTAGLGLGIVHSAHPVQLTQHAQHRLQRRRGHLQALRQRCQVQTTGLGLGAGVQLPTQGKVFLTIKNADKPRAVQVAKDLVAMGFELVATKGTAAALAAAGLQVQAVNKVTEGRPHVVDMIKNGEIAMVIHTVEDRRNAIADSRAIRTSALAARVTTFTTIFGAEAAVDGMKAMRAGALQVTSVQELHALLA